MSSWSPKIFRHISCTRQKWHYNEYGDIVTGIDTLIFNRFTFSFEHRISINRSTFLPKKVTKFTKSHRIQDIKLMLYIFVIMEIHCIILYNSLISQAIGGVVVPLIYINRGVYTHRFSDS